MNDWTIQFSVKDGKREGTFEAFAQPFVGKGLTVLTFAHVTKVTQGAFTLTGRSLMTLRNFRQFSTLPSPTVKFWTKA